MATTRESIEDGLRWMLNLLRIGVRRAVVLGVFVALFALAVVITTRERVSGCGDVTGEQKALLATLLEPDPGRTFVATEPARCLDGEYTTPIEGIDARMEEATEQLIGDGWVHQTDYIGYYRQLWRRCFRFGEPGWARIQITVDATRHGSVHTVRATAPEHVDACELERRETSDIYPPT